MEKKIEPIKELLIKMESIIGNECYNQSIQNYGPGGIWEVGKAVPFGIQLPSLSTLKMTNDGAFRLTSTQRFL